MRTRLFALIGPLFAFPFVIGCDAASGDDAAEPSTALSARLAALAGQDPGRGFAFSRSANGAFDGRAGRRRGTRVRFDAGRLSIENGSGADLVLETASVARGDRVAPTPFIAARAEDRELIVARDGGVEERFREGSFGVEQTLKIDAPPPGDGPLVASVSFEGLAPDLRGARVVLRDDAGAERASYSALAAEDADGRALASRFEVHGAIVRLVIDDRGARYPVVIDPLIDGGPVELVPASPAFATAVGVSHDTAVTLAGAAGATTNFVDVFTRAGSSWTEQQALPDRLEATVLAIDGDVVMAAEPYSDSGGVHEAGNVRVFTRTGTTWALTQTIPALHPVRQGYFGIGLAISGHLAAISAHDNVAIFSEAGGIWTLETLLPIHGIELGLALSGDTLAVLTNMVTFDVYRRAATGTWHHEQGLPAATVHIVALSGDSLIASNDQGTPGVAFYQRSGSTWTLQQTTHGSRSRLGFGSSIAIDGDRAVVGIDGIGTFQRSAQSVVIYERSGSAWVESDVLTAPFPAPSAFARDVAISGDNVVVTNSHYLSPTNTDGDALAYRLSGDECTLGTTCNTGFCTDGVCCDVAACLPVDDCHVAGVCESATHACTNPIGNEAGPCTIAGSPGICNGGDCNALPTSTSATTGSSGGGGATSGSSGGGGAGGSAAGTGGSASSSTSTASTSSSAITSTTSTSASMTSTTATSSSSLSSTSSGATSAGGGGATSASGGGGQGGSASGGARPVDLIALGGGCSTHGGTPTSLPLIALALLGALFRRRVGS